VEGMRADIVVARTAIALAALDRRDSVIDRDIETAARLALPHRARTTLAGEGWIGPERIQQAIAQTKGGVEADRAEAAPMAPRPRTPAARRDEAAPTRDIHLKPPPKADSPTGRGARGSGGEKPAVDAIPATGDDDLDVIATARAAVTRRLVGGDSAQPPFIESDLRERVRSGREANLVLCVVDASSSVLENGRGGELRALLGGLVADAKRKRDRVGLIVFRGREARLVAPPSRNHAAVLAGLDTVEPGGTTPLAEGIRVAHETAMRELRRNPDLKPIVTLVTDGYANIARGGGDALGEARLAAHDLKRAGVTLVVVGETSSGAPDFARQTGAEFYPFDPVADQRHIA
ncbi:MAG: VWA domain-containing protein, partial [Solirubrobacterales bacterium]